MDFLFRHQWAFLYLISKLWLIKGLSIYSLRQFWVTHLQWCLTSCIDTLLKLLAGIIFPPQTSPQIKLKENKMCHRVKSETTPFSEQGGAYKVYYSQDPGTKFKQALKLLTRKCCQTVTKLIFLKVSTLVFLFWLEPWQLLHFLHDVFHTHVTANISIKYYL